MYEKEIEKIKVKALNSKNIIERNIVLKYIKKIEDNEKTEMSYKIVKMFESDL